MTDLPPPSAEENNSKDLIIAIVCMLLAASLVAVTTLLAKALGPAGSGDAALHPLQVTAGRFTFAFLVLVPIVAWQKVDFKNANWRNHLLRVGFGWAGISCLFAAAASMRLADANAISFLNPIVAMILSIPLLGEKVGPWRWAGAAIAFIGAAILTEPGTNAFQPAALIALMAAIFMGAETILIKSLAKKEPTLRILILSNSLGAVVALTASSFVWKWPTPSQWAMMALLGSTMLVVQALFIQAARRGDTSFIMPFLYTTLLFAGLYDFIVFGVIPNIAGWIGASLIVTGALIVAWREHARRKQNISS